VSAFDEKGLKMFENELLKGLIPHVQEEYRVIDDADSRALAGLSMGGIQTLYAGIPNTDHFSSLGVFSSGWIGEDNKIAEAQYSYMNENAEKINQNLEHFYISEGGKEDIAYKNGKRMISKFDKMNIDYTYNEYPGGHAWPVWRHDLYTFAPLLFKNQ
ncbi:alpha/beta hydrolase-fold protein, partial [Zunongwangia profunda]